MNYTEMVIPATVFAAVVGALIKMILWQNERRLDDRFKKLDEARAEATKTLTDKFDDIDKDKRAGTAHWDNRYGRTESAVSALTERLIKVETSLSNLPTAREFAEVNTALAQLRGDTNTQTELLKRMEYSMRLINEWMMENK